MERIFPSFKHLFLESKPTFESIPGILCFSRNICFIDGFFGIVYDTCSAFFDRIKEALVLFWTLCLCFLTDRGNAIFLVRIFLIVKASSFCIRKDAIGYISEDH